MSSVEAGTAIGLAKAELLSILIEGVLYGKSSPQVIHRTTVLNALVRVPKGSPC